MSTSTSARTVDEIIDSLQKSCSRASGAIAALTVVLHDGQVFSGSAYGVDKRGYFVTAYHCIQGVVADCFITLDTLHKTTVVAIDKDNDLALLKVDAPSCEFETVTFAESVPDAESNRRWSGISRRVGCFAGVLSGSILRRHRRWYRSGRLRDQRQHHAVGAVLRWGAIGTGRLLWWTDSQRAWTRRGEHLQGLRRGGFRPRHCRTTISAFVKKHLPVA